MSKWISNAAITLLCTLGIIFLASMLFHYYEFQEEQEEVLKTSPLELPVMSTNILHASSIGNVDYYYSCFFGDIYYNVIRSAKFGSYAKDRLDTSIKLDYKCNDWLKLVENFNLIKVQSAK